jgi:hypothetical protein
MVSWKEGLRDHRDGTAWRPKNIRRCQAAAVQGGLAANVRTEGTADAVPCRLPAHMLTTFRLKGELRAQLDEP